MVKLFVALTTMVLFATCTQCIAQTDEDEGNKIVFQDGSTYDNDFRVWSTAEGEFTVVAKFDSFLNAEVVRLIRKDTGKVIDVRISILAPDDRELLEKIRKDVALKLLPPSKEASLERYKLGIEELFRLEKEHRAKTSAINDAEDLLSVKKESKLEAAEKVYKRKLASVEINLHLLIEDVKDIGGRLSVEGQFALAGDDGAGLEVSNVSLSKSDDTLAKLKKGGLIRLTCNISPRINGTSTATVKMIDQTYDLVITGISTLSEMDEKMLPNAKIWYEDIAKAINAARLDSSAPLVKKHLPQLPTLATLQRITEIAKLSEASREDLYSCIEGLPELMSEVAAIRNEYLEEISESDAKDDLNPQQYATYTRVVKEIAEKCLDRLQEREVSVLSSGSTVQDVKYGLTLRLDSDPPTRFDSEYYIKREIEEKLNKQSGYRWDDKLNATQKMNVVLSRTME